MGNKMTGISSIVAGPKINVKKVLDTILKGSLIQCTDSNSKTCSAEVSTYFCPEDNCADHLIEEIDSADKSIHIAIYSFTLDEIVDALCDKAKDIKDIKVIMDASQADDWVVEDLEDCGIGVKVVTPDHGNGAFPSMHNKFAVIDGEVVCNGSFNYTSNGNYYNDENLQIQISNCVAKQFEGEFQEIWSEH